MGYVIKLFYADESIDTIEADGIYVQLMARPATNPTTEQYSFEVIIKNMIEFSGLDLEQKCRTGILLTKIEYIKNNNVLKTFSGFGPGVYSLQTENQGNEIGAVPVESLRFYKV